MRNISHVRTELFENMPVRKAVLRQVVPAVASQMVTLLYNIADTYYVGMLNLPAHTAAITVSAASFIMLTAISNLFGVGGASALAQALGRKRPADARDISSVALYGGALCSLLYSVLFTFLSNPLLTICGATDETYDLCLRYAKWAIIYGGPFTVMNMLIANLIRAEGEAAKASFGVSMGAVLNIILDPFFILPQFMGLGAEGAGIATAISNCAAFCYFAIYIFRSPNSVVNIVPGSFRQARAHTKNILLIGLPSALQYLLIVIAVSAQSGFISKYSIEAVAALGIAKKMDQLPLNFALGVSAGLLPLLAYNYSSGNNERRQAAFRFGCSLSVGFALLCLICYELFAPQLTSLFISDQLTCEYSSAFLRRMVIAMPLMALCNPIITQFQAMGMAKESIICSVLRKGILDIPLLYIMDVLSPLYGCMWVQPIVDSIALTVAFKMMSGNTAKKRKR